MTRKKIRKVEGPCPACIRRATSDGRPASDGKSEMVLQGDRLRCLRCNALHDLAFIATDFANAIAKTASEQMRFQLDANVSMPVTWTYHHGYDSTVFLVDLLHAVAQALDEKTLQPPGPVTH